MEDKTLYCIFQIYKDMCTRREVMKLPVYCQYSEYGCSETPEWKNLLVSEMIYLYQLNLDLEMVQINNITLSKD